MSNTKVPSKGRFFFWFFFLINTTRPWRLRFLNTEKRIVFLFEQCARKSTFLSNIAHGSYHNAGTQGNIEVLLLALNGIF